MSDRPALWRSLLYMLIFSLAVDALVVWALIEIF